MKSIQVDDEFYKKISNYAVFIPLVEINGKDHILFEIRSNIVKQPGEVSFPGGGLEYGESFEMAAIRETMEELNLNEKDIELMGYSSMILSSSNRHIKAFYGKICREFENISYNQEVSSLFTVDINYFINNPPKKYTAKLDMNFPKDFPFDKIPNGKDYNFHNYFHTMYFYDTKPVIWGLTAKLLKDFIKIYQKR
ncbi:CoA pyrophosphatase [Anaerococcus sp. AGMB00486]|uniref:CoA pyrophosphatase n=2 Tax=Anaerococcus TaxID=165779 RepID=A0ABX2N9I9_9FIRM|nr:MULTISPECIES: CoA pyrophosphatase [Anaerococcus]MDY3006139.1 CoA pyrophosphatase [Anaerococcus porci]MSS78495.1 CoA pyrophosphatase [Anaerococcus porci]NVF11351.1 CoA pyrophosphatase [Anaerococcus faecalis]